MENDRLVCQNQRTKMDKNIWDYVASVITPEFGPAGSISNRFGTDSASMAKAKCYPDAQYKNTECFFYCPNPANPSRPKKINQKFKCITRAGVWKPKINGRMANKLKCE